MEVLGLGLVQHLRCGAGLSDLNINSRHRKHKASLGDGVVNGELRAAAAD